jgi:hypothetical protein
VDGMTPAFVECNDSMMRLYALSSYLCSSCRKMAARINGNFRDMQTQINGLEEELKEAANERKRLGERIEKLEGGAVQVKDKVVGMEKQIESGMEEATKAVTEAMQTEKKEIEEKATNIIIHGMKESTKEKGEERKKEDEENVKGMLRAMEVEVEEEMEVKWRLGKKPEDTATARPLVIKLASKEAKEGVLKQGRKLKRKDEWSSVYVSPDLTYRQRMEARKEETKLKEEVAKKNEEEKNDEDREGEWIVVGPRGKRRIVRKRENVARA